MTDIKPFDPTIPKEEVDRLWRKLKDTRLPKTEVVPGAGDDYGPPLNWIHKLYDKYVNSYSWEAAQKKFGKWSHYTTTIEDLRIHFIHERAETSSSSNKPIPILIVHGWPGSFYESSRAIDALKVPSSSGQVFDVVVPSLPGFCWSQGPPRGWTLQDSARIFDTLMQRLGYDRYVAAGGDWGHWVVRELGANPKYENHCVSLYTNMCPSQPPVSKDQWDEKEQWAQKMMDWWLGEPGYEWHMGYAVEMRTRPQTIGTAICDHPVGIMMWIGEKYYELVDPKFRDLEDDDFVSDILTTVSLYFFTLPSTMTSMLCYTNNVRHEWYVEFNTSKENLIKRPFGFSAYKWDISPTSARAAKTTGNLQWYNAHETGGHFAMLENPEAYVEDLRDCFAKLW